MLCHWNNKELGWVGSVVAIAVCMWTVGDAAAQEKKVSGVGGANDSKTEVPVFMRIVRDGSDEPKSLQVAVAHYVIESGEFKGARIDLIGAVHVGAKSYYDELNTRFKKYDALLYELVADPSANKPHQRADRGGFNPIGGLQTGMKDVMDLKFQLDEVDYSPKNFVHADMSPGEFAKDMNDRGDGFVGMFARMMGAGFAVQSSPKAADQQAKMMAALVSKDPVQLRVAMAEQFESMDIQMAALAAKDGKSTLLTQRNGKAFSVMTQELKAGKKSIGVFYGAGHLSDMHQRLLRDFDAKQIDIEWLDAWDLKYR